MKFRVGDKVKIREDLIVGKSYNGWDFIEGMNQYKGQIKLVKSAEVGYYTFEGDGYGWTDSMLEEVIKLPKEVGEEIESSKSVGNSLMLALQFEARYSEVIDYLYNNTGGTVGGNFNIERLKKVIKAWEYGWIPEKSSVDIAKEMLNEINYEEFQKMQELFEFAKENDIVLEDIIK
jgi:hypothetical protein